MTRAEPPETALVVAGMVLVLMLAAVPGIGPAGAAPVPTGGLGIHGPRPSDDGGNPPPHPAPFTWTDGAVDLTLAGATPSFYVSSPAANRSNVSVTVLGVAEIAPNGTIDAIGGLSSEMIGWSLRWVNSTAGGVQVNLTGSVPVGSAHGFWNASELPEMDGGILGSSTVRLVFHLANGTGGTSPWTVTFDLGVGGWPWVNGSDRLGVVLGLRAVGAASFRQGTDNVEENANGTGDLVATLAWGPSASVSYANGTAATAMVSSGASASGYERQTLVRLLFGGVRGLYTSLYYDPSVTLNPAATFVRSVPPGAGPFGWLSTNGGVVGVGAGLAVVAVLGWTAFRRGSAHPRNRLARLRGRSDAPSSAGLPGARATAGRGVAP